MCPSDLRGYSMLYCCCMYFCPLVGSPSANGYLVRGPTKSDSDISYGKKTKGTVYSGEDRVTPPWSKAWGGHSRESAYWLGGPPPAGAVVRVGCNVCVVGALTDRFLAIEAGYWDME